MRIAIIKDPHFQFDFPSPANRLNFEATMRGKLDFILSFIKEQNISEVLLTGDVFDSSDSKNGICKGS